MYVYLISAGKVVMSGELARDDVCEPYEPIPPKEIVDFNGSGKRWKIKFADPDDGVVEVEWSGEILISDTELRVADGILLHVDRRQRVM